MVVRALVVGSLVMDLAFKIPRRPEPGEVIVADDFGQFRGGKGYNQAVALARLGAEVSMIGAVGADPYGEAFIEALEREGIEGGRVVQTRGTSTAVAVPLITPDGLDAFVQYQGANRQLAPAHCADLPDCDVLLLQGEISAATSEAAARVINRRGGTVLLNPAPVHDITPRLLDSAAVITPNFVEARALTGLLGLQVDPDDHRGLAAALRGQGRTAVVTLGKLGAVWASDEGVGSVSGFAVTAVDGTGAGDSFAAALAVSLAEGAAMADAVRYACAAGAHSVTIVGAEPSLPTRAQVEALIAASTR